MRALYSTVTSKGQITLPSSQRRTLGLTADLADVRARAQAEMRAAGTWGAAVSASDGWRAAAAEKLPPTTTSRDTGLTPRRPPARRLA